VDSSSWAKLSEKEFLNKRICDLKLSIVPQVKVLIDDFYKELEAKNLSFRPPCFLADEWFCPVGVPAIGIPFFLTHPRLKQIERKMMLEVEGGTKRWFMKLIRHEGGHAYSYAYKLYKKKRWQQLFGLASKTYPDAYRPRPYSRSYVPHLDNWYAQSHPDEDFAETFAVWMTPGINWRKRYRRWPVLKKLDYVDSIMKEIAGKHVVEKINLRRADYDGLKIKLKSYYSRKKKMYAEDFPDFYDNDLKELFWATSGLKATRYLRSHRKRILESVSLWTKEKQYTIDQLLKDLIDRCDELNLYAPTGDAALDLNTASFITSLVVNYLFTGKFRRSKPRK
jgi:hypothetical protein